MSDPYFRTQKIDQFGTKLCDLQRARLYNNGMAHNLFIVKAQMKFERSIS